MASAAMTAYMKRITEHRKAREQGKVYDDQLYFDSIRQVLPDPYRTGRLVMSGSFFLQAALIGIGFLLHHYKKTAFGCCNMWAIVVAALFIVLQWPYYADWCSKLGAKAEWHRANVFVPFFVFTVLFIMWLAAVSSFLAHELHKEYFEMKWSVLSSLEVLSFIVMASTGFVACWCYIAIAYAQRNNLGVHYYAPGEGAVALVHLRPDPIIQHGSFNYRNTLGFMARMCGLETSLNADKNYTTVLLVAFVLQIPFYLFAGLAYGEGNQSALLLTLIIIGAADTAANGLYTMGAMERTNRKARKWHRTHLFFPLYSFFFIIWTFFFTQSTVFFQADKNHLWEDILFELDPVSGFIFALSVIILFANLGCQWLIANIHRKSWAEGTANVDDGLEYGPPDDQGRPTPARLAASSSVADLEMGAKPRSSPPPPKSPKVATSSVSKRKDSDSESERKRASDDEDDDDVEVEVEK